MNISAVSDSMLQQISNTATQNGDAVTITMLRKAMDIQSSQAAQLIQSVTESMPDPANPLGQHVNVRV